MISLFNIWFGPLPNYFNFFAKSCLFSKEWHWYLFTDSVKIQSNYNSNITLIPYSWNKLYEDCYYLVDKNKKINSRWYDVEKSNLTIWPKNGWPCRLYLINLHKDLWRHSDFVGTFDCDIIYGDLSSKMPKNMNEFGMITGHSGVLHPTMKNKKRICMPFCLFRNDCVEFIFNYKEKRSGILDANYEFSDFFSSKFSIFAGNNIQPVGDTIPYTDKRFAIWNKGKLFVNQIESGFYHFMYEKSKKNFKIRNNDFKSDFWILDQNGIRSKNKIYL